MAAMPVLEQEPLGRGAPLHQRGPQAMRERGAQLALVAGVLADNGFELRRDRKYGTTLIMVSDQAGQ